MTDRYDPIFQAAAEAAHLPDWTILKAIAFVESSMEETAIRFGAAERKLYKRLIQNRPAWQTHRYYGQPEVMTASYGLMQVLYITAITVGFPREGDWWLLLEPETNIALGAKYLRSQLDRYGNISSAVAAYNAGRAYLKDGKFTNQRYVDRVMQAAHEARIS